MQSASSSQPHIGGIPAERSSASSTPAQKGHPTAIAPALTASTSTPRDDGSAKHSGGGPISAEWALVIVTAVLAWFTFWLWNATRKLVADAKDTGEGELRAYVGVRRGKFKDQIATPQHSVQYRFQPVIKNSGRTPAYDVSYDVRAFISEYLTPTFDYTLDKANEKRIGVLGPGEKWPVTLWAEKFYSPVEVAVLKPGGHGYLWLYGEVKYRDAFGVSRYTRFAYWINPPTKSWTIHQWHNDAT